MKCAFIASFYGPYYSNFVASMISFDKKMKSEGDTVLYILPKETENLIKIVEIRNDARKLGITRIKVQGDFIIFEPNNLRIRLTNKNANDILINVQLEIEKLKL